MAKAILVMDMPERCDDCDLWDYDRETDLSYCGSWSGRGRLDDTSSKPDWCPLIPEPERKNEDISVSFVSDIRRDDLDKIIEMGKIAGWNACIDYLEGET